MNKPVIGQIVYVESDKDVDEYKVVKVGRKYFYVEPAGDYRSQYRVLLENWHIMFYYGQRQVYYRPGDIIRKKEADKTIREIKKIFEWCYRPSVENVLSLEELKEIKKIIDNSYDKLKDKKKD